jgi:hypothetical protein
MAGELRCKGGNTRHGAGWRGEAGCGGIQWWCGRGQLAWGGRDLTGKAHLSARGEREDTEDGRHESKRKTHSQKYAKGY